MQRWADYCVHSETLSGVDRLRATRNPLKQPHLQRLAGELLPKVDLYQLSDPARENLTALIAEGLKESGLFDRRGGK
jgi:hypothetical protein